MFVGDLDGIERQGMYQNDQKQNQIELQSHGHTGAMRSQEK